jgi:hypothetical protein
LGKHLRECKGCKPNFKNSEVLARSGSQLSREIIETTQIHEKGAVSNPSRILSQEEMEFILNN